MTRKNPLQRSIVPAILTFVASAIVTIEAAWDTESARTVIVAQASGFLLVLASWWGWSKWAPSARVDTPRDGDQP